MKILDTASQFEIEAEIVELETIDLKTIANSGQFIFDWSSVSNVYKLILKGDETSTILGLISLDNIPEELRIHINLIENSNNNKGKKKTYDRIAGCLIAFAIRLAFTKGYLGFTSLIPKTELIDLYIKKYGFTRYGKQLAIERTAAIKLIQKYL